MRHKTFLKKLSFQMRVNKSGLAIVCFFISISIMSISIYNRFDNRNEIAAPKGPKFISFPKTRKKGSKVIKILQQIDIFDSVLFPVYEAFLELGIPVSWATDFDTDDDDTIYITAATHTFVDRIPKHYISYNWEQMTIDKVWPAGLYEKFQNAIEVWDYSKTNAEALRAKGIKKVEVLLPGYNFLQGTGMISNFPKERDLDLVFVGSLNSRRQQFWDSVKSRIETDRVYFGDGDLPSLITRAKVGLNPCHFYGGSPPLEIHRIMLMVSNYVLVMSARGKDEWLDNVFEPFVTFYDDEDDFVRKFEELRSLTEEEWGVLVMKRLRAFQNHPSFKDNLLASNSSIFGIFNKTQIM